MTNPAQRSQGAHAAVPMPKLYAWSRGWAGFYRWRQDARERAEIASLSDRALRDLGISRAELMSYRKDKSVPLTQRQVAAITVSLEGKLPE